MPARFKRIPDFLILYAVKHVRIGPEHSALLHGGVQKNAHGFPEAVFQNIARYTGLHNEPRQRLALAVQKISVQHVAAHIAHFRDHVLDIGLERLPVLNQRVPLADKL